jgi:hypothetical protein
MEPISFADVIAVEGVIFGRAKYTLEALPPQGMQRRDTLSLFFSAERRRAPFFLVLEPG